MVKTSSASRLEPVSCDVSHNLVGQRLGRKGQNTRERILAALLRLLEEPGGSPITLTAVAREAAVGIATLYLYFPDMGELLIAALRRVMGAAEETFIHRLRRYWPDETLADECQAFVREHYQFWRRYAGLLHMRNSFADACDLRVLAYRTEATSPIIGLLMMQMGQPAGTLDMPCAHLATVVLTGFERVATVVTNPHFHITSKTHGDREEADYIANLIAAEGRLVEFAIRHQRTTVAG